MSSWVVARRNKAGEWIPLSRTMTAAEAHEYADRQVARGLTVVAVDLNSLVERLPRLDTSHDVEHDS